MNIGRLLCNDLMILILFKIYIFSIFIQMEKQQFIFPIFIIMAFIFTTKVLYLKKVKFIIIFTKKFVKIYFYLHLLYFYGLG
jgi:hypothetical protein